MTDEQIEKALQEMILTLNWGTVERIGAVSTDGSGDNKHNGVPKDIAVIQAALDYIERLKDERDYWKAQFEFQAEQDKNALMGEQEIRKDTAKEILNEVEMYSICRLRDDGYKEYTISELALNEISDKFGGGR